MKILPLVVILMLPAVYTFADTIHLKDGAAVTGNILEKNDKSVRIEVDGVPMTYYMDEIKDIDGTAPAAKAAPAKVPAEVPQAETPAPPVPAVVETPANVPQNKKDLILKFIDVFGTRAAMISNLDSMIKSMPADAPETQKLKDNLKVDEIIDRLVPIYDRQFSEKDLKAYIDFYSSPQGRKLIEGIPVIMRESVGISTQYLQDKFPEFAQQGNKNTEQ